MGCDCSNEPTGIGVVLGAMGLSIAVIFGNWLNNIFNLGWGIPHEWYSLAWIILAGSFFAFIILFIIAIILVIISEG